MTATSAYLHGLADAYRFVGVFLDVPGAEVAEGVVNGSAADDLVGILNDAGASDAEAAAVLEAFNGGAPLEAEIAAIELRRDFTRLFTNPEKPLVSVYEATFKGADDFDTSKLAFVSPTALDAERCYRRWGIEVGGARRESPDHMGAEVDFISFLLEAWAQALEEGDRERAERAHSDIRGFLDTHFLKWGEPLFAVVADKARTGAYRGVGRLGALLARKAAEYPC